MVYQPKPGSLCERVCAFFYTHPNEELTAGDIAKKFAYSSNSVHTKLMPALDADWLRRMETDDGKVYIRGPALREVRISAEGASDAASHTPPANGGAFKNWLAGRAEQSAEGRPKTLPLPDPDALVIEHNVPMPAPIPPGVSKYHPLFQRMAPGDSFACDVAVAKRLCNVAMHWGKRNGSVRFSMRVMGDGTARIWRDASKGGAA